MFTVLKNFHVLGICVRGSYTSLYQMIWVSNTGENASDHHIFGQRLRIRARYLDSMEGTGCFGSRTRDSAGRFTEHSA